MLASIHPRGWMREKAKLPMRTPLQQSLPSEVVKVNTDRPAARYWTAGETASRLGKSLSWFRLHRQELEACGFPAHDGLLGYDSYAVEAWCDRRSGLTEGGQTINACASTEEAKALAAILGT